MSTEQTFTDFPSEDKLIFCNCNCILKLASARFLCGLNGSGDSVSISVSEDFKNTCQ